MDVTCVWEGTVRVQAAVSMNNRLHIEEFMPGDTRSVFGRHITLVRVMPHAHPTQDILPEEYVFEFRMTVR